MRLRSKYGVRTDALGKAARTADGILFASQRECDRYRELKLLEKKGIIRHLRTQPRYPLYAIRADSAELVTKVGDYVADFSYEEYLALGAPEIAVQQTSDMIYGWVRVVEDVKGVKTNLYKLKKKLFEANYGREIRET